VDGKNVVMMPPACDYKRLQDGDQGPLTGGMGSYSPTQYVTPELWEQVEKEIMVRAVEAMQAAGTPYRGVLYAGLMITRDGPKVLEFNCRLGDPEAQVLLPRLQTPFEDIAMAVAEGDLARAGEIRWSDEVAVGVVLASEGYPARQASPHKVAGLADVSEGVLVFHAGTRLQGAMPLKVFETERARPSVLGGLFGRKSEQSVPKLNTDLLSPNITATGGRLLTIVALGSNFQEARERVYSNVPRIGIDGVQYRTDIAARELASEDPPA
jgi:phosphoribosylamine--glycine ligase